MRAKFLYVGKFNISDAARWFKNTTPLKVDPLETLSGSIRIMLPDWGVVTPIPATAPILALALAIGDSVGWGRKWAQRKAMA